jgi:hypothetical protein
LKSSFDDTRITSFPNSIQELKGAQPSSWNKKIEQILFFRSMSFSEFEALSNPSIVLTAVASSDADPVAAMQELQSHHHTPQCFVNVS